VLQASIVLCALLLLPAALPIAGAQYCPAGAAAVCDKVLVVGADEPSSLEDVQTTLLDTAAFAAVDTFDALSATPTAAQLSAYDAVLVFSNWSFADPALLSDRLAAYHDQGGGVVVTHGVLGKIEGEGANVVGAYGVSNGYALMDYASGNSTSPPDLLGDVLEPLSPLMTGVASLAAEEAYRSTAPVVAGRGVVVARWAGGGQEPLVVRGTRGNRTLVELNFYPPSSRLREVYWTGDGGALLRNALKFSRCMPCGKGTYADAGEERGAGGGAVCVCARARARVCVLWRYPAKGCQSLWSASAHRWGVWRSNTRYCSWIM
jgi:hypothetical protein